LFNFSDLPKPDRSPNAEFAMNYPVEAPKEHAGDATMVSQIHEQALQAIVAGTYAKTGADFFRSLVCHLAAALQVRYAFITECVNAPTTSVRTLAFWTGKDFGANFEYALAGTPCENVIDGAICYYPSNIQALFPYDRDLVSIGAESYLGVPLYDSAARVLGHLAVLDVAVMRDAERRKAILQIFAARAGAELERKQAEAALRESEERFRQMAEQIGEVFWMCDPAKQQMIYINPAYEQIWGRARASIYADPHSFLTTIHPEDRERIRAALSKQAQGTYDEEYRIVWPDRSIHWIHDRAFPIRNAQGEIYRIAGIAADITMRKQSEEAIRLSSMQAQVIRAQESALRELSTPLIPISDRVVVMPLIGAIDSRRAEQVMQTLLDGLVSRRADIAILDITGVMIVDTQVANALIAAAQAIKLLGATAILTGIRPEVAQTLISLGIDMRGIVTCGTLQSGISYALGHRPAR
jgi:PAS domain S-box-containing protein